MFYDNTKHTIFVFPLKQQHLATCLRLMCSDCSFTHILLLLNLADPHINSMRVNQTRSIANLFKEHLLI